MDRLDKEITLLVIALIGGWSIGMGIGVLLKMCIGGC